MAIAAETAGSPTQQPESENVMKQARRISDELVDVLNRTARIAGMIVGEEPSPLAGEDEAAKAEASGFQQQMYDQQSDQFEVLENIRTALNRIETFI